ncbi:transcriptional adapter 1 isoform X4 [Malaclemys terrapin pileata]|uniref:transcriptional adapter 1 isoform X4 n=1 Tax=Malaclemys terrapin pileata TaxID=2991368 RepID=UPI0023A83E79|nr:transcriptional adapter 1 isoform X4 [Malaclemys terrapin pileata]
MAVLMQSSVFTEVVLKRCFFLLDFSKMYGRKGIDLVGKAMLFTVLNVLSPMHRYWANLKLWFKQKISKEEFDLEARRLLTQDNVHSHNDFLLAILTRCQILVSAPEGPGPLPWTGGSATKPGKPKGKKKFSSVRQKFDHRFQPQNPLSGAQQFVAKDPQEDDDLKLCSHTMMLPTRGQLEGRMIVTAYEHGLDNVTEEAVTAIVYAVQLWRLASLKTRSKHCKQLLRTCASGGLHSRLRTPEASLISRSINRTRCGSNFLLVLSTPSHPLQQFHLRKSP